MERCYLCFTFTGLVAARTSKEADVLVNLVEIFEIRELGELIYFLGIEIQCNQGAETITLTQRAKAEALAIVHGIQEACKAVPRLPMSPGCFAGCIAWRANGTQARLPESDP
jgi:hypothetical protein